MSAPARSGRIGFRERPAFWLGVVAMVGFLLAGMPGMLGLALVFTLVVWVLGR